MLSDRLRNIEYVDSVVLWFVGGMSVMVLMLSVGKISVKLKFVSVVLMSVMCGIGVSYSSMRFEYLNVNDMIVMWKLL